MNDKHYYRVKPERHYNRIAVGYRRVGLVEYLCDMPHFEQGTHLRAVLSNGDIVIIANPQKLAFNVMDIVSALTIIHHEKVENWTIEK